MVERRESTCNTGIIDKDVEGSSRFGQGFRHGRAVGDVHLDHFGSTTTPPDPFARFLEPLPASRCQRCHRTVAREQLGEMSAEAGRSPGDEHPLPLEITEQHGLNSPKNERALIFYFAALPFAIG
jgi:hypothetical protein